MFLYTYEVDLSARVGSEGTNFEARHRLVESWFWRHGQRVTVTRDIPFACAARRQCR